MAWRRGPARALLRRSVVGLWAAGLAVPLSVCVSIQRAPSGPDLFAQVEKACRAQAGYYNDPAPVYVECMRKRGYKGMTEADY